MLLFSGPIGVFDSGVGGLSVLRHIRSQLPGENLIYFADSGYAPYGDKSEEFVIERAFKIAGFFLKQGIKALVVACNTATAITIHLLREKYPELPIVGVEPGLKPAAAKTITGIVGVMATERTLASNKFHVLHQLLNDQTGVHFIMQPCPGMADLIEHEELDSEPVFNLVRRYLTPILEQNADTVVLGCTHYPFVRHVIEKIAAEAGNPSLHIIDTGYAVARQLKHLLDIYGLNSKGRETDIQTAAFTSGDPQTISRLIGRLLQIDMPVSYLSL
ncbi:glutamate racemase [Oxalobacter paraformigenes]|uniref:Glutamate racemase n=1 Tax=Oxalobacter paraformigenes TaxID=556268 RepID=C3X1H4_9BURK|nr:glutamate racemase [Oxalobacter paraformigenes]EEO27060.1 glutamate racemase [Oxalobacter paraformigenes]